MIRDLYSGGLQHNLHLLIRIRISLYYRYSSCVLINKVRSISEIGVMNIIAFCLIEKLV